MVTQKFEPGLYHLKLDNPIWIKDVYENKPHSINEALEDMDENGVKHFRSFLNELKKIGWF